MSPLRATVKLSEIEIFDRQVTSFSGSVSSDFISDQCTVFSESISTGRLSQHSMYLLIILTLGLPIINANLFLPKPVKITGF